MSRAPSIPVVDEAILAEGLDQLAAGGADAGAVQALAELARTGDDRDAVRINPVQFAEDRALATGAVVDVFLHARNLGLATMEWQYVCPGCGDVVERLASLTSASAHVWCQVCSVERDAELSDFIAVTFSLSPALRHSPYHDPWSLEPREYFLDHRFTQDGVVGDGTPLRELLARCGVVFAYVQPGETRTFPIEAEPRFVWLTNGPALTVGAERTTERRRFAFEYRGVRSAGSRADIAAGPIEIAFTNASDERYALMITNLPDHYDLTLRSFLSGAEVLSNQTFLDLFAHETIVAGEGLAVQRLTFLFTDLKGSTALYDRIGDLKAFDLVRQHFGHLRACISRNSGALVKTIGDAVMASFVDPLDALRAALEMRDEIARFNAGSGEELIGLKVGMHSGACLAVTLNERLDYFGQTVNVAARVQGLAEAGEILVTDDVLSVRGAAEVVAGLEIVPGDAELRGVAGAVRVHRVRDR